MRERGGKKTYDSGINWNKACSMENELIKGERKPPPAAVQHNQQQNQHHKRDLLHSLVEVWPPLSLFLVDLWWTKRGGIINRSIRSKIMGLGIIYIHTHTQCQAGGGGIESCHLPLQSSRLEALAFGERPAEEGGGGGGLERVEGFVDPVLLLLLFGWFCCRPGRRDDLETVLVLVLDDAIPFHYYYEKKTKRKTLKQRRRRKCKLENHDEPLQEETNRQLVHSW